MSEEERSGSSRPQKPFSSQLTTTEVRDITIIVQPTTGGTFNVTVKNNISVLELRHTIARKLQMPKDRLAMLCKNKVLQWGSISEYDISDGSRVVLMPNVETGFAAGLQNTEQSIVQAIEGLSDQQIDEFLSGRAPLTLALRVDDHMMFVQLQLEQTGNNGQASTSQGVGQASRPTHNTNARIIKTHQQNPNQPPAIPQSNSNNNNNNNNNQVQPQQPGACINTFVRHGPGVFSGTFSGSLHPSIQDEHGRPKRDPKTILQILNDLLSATQNYQGPNLFQAQNVSAATPIQAVQGPQGAQNNNNNTHGAQGSQGAQGPAQNQGGSQANQKQVQPAQQQHHQVQHPHHRSQHQPQQQSQPQQQQQSQQQQQPQAAGQQQQQLQQHFQNLPQQLQLGIGHHPGQFLPVPHAFPLHPAALAAYHHAAAAAQLPNHLIDIIKPSSSKDTPSKDEEDKKAPTHASSTSKVQRHPPPKTIKSSALQHTVKKAKPTPTPTRQSARLKAKYEKKMKEERELQEKLKKEAEEKAKKEAKKEAKKLKEQQQALIQAAQVNSFRNMHPFVHPHHFHQFAQAAAMHQHNAQAAHAQVQAQIAAQQQQHQQAQQQQQAHQQQLQKQQLAAAAAAYEQNPDHIPDHPKNILPAMFAKGVRAATTAATIPIPKKINEVPKVNDKTTDNEVKIDDAKISRESSSNQSQSSATTQSSAHKEPPKTEPQAATAEEPLHPFVAPPPPPTVGGKMKSSKRTRPNSSHQHYPFGCLPHPGPYIPYFPYPYNNGNKQAQHQFYHPYMLAYANPYHQQLLAAQHAAAARNQQQHQAKAQKAQAQEGSEAASPSKNQPTSSSQSTSPLTLPPTTGNQVHPSQFPGLYNTPPAAASTSSSSSSSNPPVLNQSTALQHLQAAAAAQQLQQSMLNQQRHQQQQQHHHQHAMAMQQQMQHAAAWHHHHQAHLLHHHHQQQFMAAQHYHHQMHHHQQQLQHAFAHHHNLLPHHLSGHPQRPASSTSPNSAAAASFILPTSARLSARYTRTGETHDIENAKTKAKVSFIKAMLNLQKQRRKQRHLRRLEMIGKMSLNEADDKGEGDNYTNGDDIPVLECNSKTVDAFLGAPWTQGTSAQGTSSGDEIPTSPAMRTSNIN